MSQVVLPSTSATPIVELSFSPLEIAAARCAVKRLIARGEWGSRTDLMMLPDFVVEEILTEEAVKFLQLQKARRYGYAERDPRSPLCGADEALGQFRESLRSLPSQDEAELQDGETAGEERAGEGSEGL